MSKLPTEPPASEVTPEDKVLHRREFLRSAALFAGTAAGLGGSLVALTAGGGRTDAPLRPAGQRLAVARRGEFLVDEPRTPFADVASYNNYYEFGTGKGDPAVDARGFVSRPWTLQVGGEVARPRTIDIDTLTSWFPLEERVYRMRCVEAWSMVIPWLGFPLGELIRRLEPTSRAKYVAFTTLLDPDRMPGQRSSVLDWPYVEGLRIDEATNPLALFALGLYGRALPPQNGAPLRLVVPWKYGFKGIKAIVRIDFVERRPPTTWNGAAPAEYGFFANVNPEVDHPRWSQSTERRIGEFGRRPTMPFNGYGEQVASLYSGMDLRRSF